MMMHNNYWNDTYWKKRLDIEKQYDFLSDIWLDKYQDILSKVPLGMALDLGCGLGQYTEYLLNRGYDVISADISPEVLKHLKSRLPMAKTQVLDMSKSLPFEDNTFSLVFANLSIHYFDTPTTFYLLEEIRRVLKPDGYFIGSVNSDKTFVFIKDHAIKIDDNYYEDDGVKVRLFNRKQFDTFFTNFTLEALHEVSTKRWGRPKIMWEFIYKNKKSS